MRLSKLTLHGFKSFADKTEFTFDEPLTGIVGPNGCGKSNVVDAIKWVLGERSSKSLRGTEMLDVIFAGSAGRKPAGLASVTLTFENPIRAEKAAEVEALVAAAPTSEAASAEGAEAANADGATAEAQAAPALDVAPATDASGDIESDVLDFRARGKRTLPIDADVVEVERRLYRDGASAYLINGRRARLRDIRELFLDTGVGADAYSIIEQGKVDAMLLANPQERRVIFEEAAGVAKYKQRRIETERKLERTQQNLTLAREQLDNTERRLRIVTGQAAKARKFKELDEHLSAWRMALAFEQYDDLRRRLEGLTSRQSELETTRAEASERLTEAETARQSIDTTRHQLAADLRRVEQELTGAEHARAQSDQRLHLTRQSIEESTRQAQADQARATELASRIEELKAQAVDQSRIVTELSASLEGAEVALRDVLRERAEVQSALAAAGSELVERRNTVNRIDRERAAIAASLHADLKRADQFKDQADRARNRTGELAKESETIDASIAAAGERLAGSQSRTGELERALAEHESSLEKLATDRRDQAVRVAQSEQEYARLESRRATLEEMTLARVGFAESVRAVLAQNAKARAAGAEAPFAGVIAPLADLVEPVGPHARAVEIALGNSLQALLVRSIDHVPSGPALESLPGRVSFVPITPLTSAAGGTTTDLDADLAQYGGRVLPIRSLVRARVQEDFGASAGIAETEIDGLLDRALSRTFLVDSLETAMLLLAGPLHSLAGNARFVTHAGAVLEADGLVVAGPTEASPASGVLQRRDELNQLTPKIAALETELRTLREALAQADRQTSDLTVAARELRVQLTAAQRQTAQQQSELDRFHADARRIARDRAAGQNELEQCQVRLERAQADAENSKAKGESLARLLEEQSAALVAAEEKQRHSQAASDAMSERATAAKVAISTLSEQVASARRDASRTTIARDEAQRHERSLRERIATVDQRIAEHRATIERCEQELGQLDTQIEALRAVSWEAAAKLKEAEATAEAVGERLRVARQHATIVDRDWQALELSKRELEVKRESLEDRSFEDLSLKIAEEYTAYREMIDSGDVARIDTAHAALEIDSLRDGIKKLGSVNLDAIEELTQLQTRNDDLIRQVKDLDDAAAEMAKLIENLNAVSKERFEDVFKRIQNHFAGKDGMFRRLFGGGHAEVRLMGLVKEIQTATGTEKVQTDETDVLESGIEIIAKPPGKEPRSISQLSGGEKTLTAVALLLAIFRSKPSCFCILDEVDAALDEANVARYNHVIRQFTDRSGFIVITHNKRTMNNMDRLFGVTMQERGVSTRVSVKFDKADAGETPKPSAGSTPENSTETAGEAAAASESAEPVLVGASGEETIADRASEIATPPSGNLRKALAQMRRSSSAAESAQESSAETAT
jgi:chromosome segregation protein